MFLGTAARGKAGFVARYAVIFVTFELEDPLGANRDSFWRDLRARNWCPGLTFVQ